MTENLTPTTAEKTRVRSAATTAPQAAPQIIEPAGGTYTFRAYEQDANDEARQDLPFAAGFDISPYSFMYRKYDDIATLAREYWTVVRRETHGDWFRPEAWDPATGMIIMDRRNNGDPSQILCVRSRAATQAEVAAQQAASARLHRGKDSRSKPAVPDAASPEDVEVRASNTVRAGRWNDLMPS